jgi:hypothetical protein
VVAIESEGIDESCFESLQAEGEGLRPAARQPVPHRLGSRAAKLGSNESDANFVANNFAAALHNLRSRGHLPICSKLHGKDAQAGALLLPNPDRLWDGFWKRILKAKIRGWPSSFMRKRAFVKYADFVALSA